MNYRYALILPSLRLVSGRPLSCTGPGPLQMWSTRISNQSGTLWSHRRQIRTGSATHCRTDCEYWGLQSVNNIFWINSVSSHLKCRSPSKRFNERRMERTVVNESVGGQVEIGDQGRDNIELSLNKFEKSVSYVNGLYNTQHWVLPIIRKAAETKNVRTYPR